MRNMGQCSFTEIQHSLSHQQITDEPENLMLLYIELIRKGMEARLLLVIFNPHILTDLRERMGGTEGGRVGGRKQTSISCLLYSMCPTGDQTHSLLLYGMTLPPIGSPCQSCFRYFHTTVFFHGYF